MKNIALITAILSSLLLLTGCQQKQKENLAVFIAEANNIRPAPIEPLPNIVPAEKFTYGASSLTEPFDPGNLKPEQVVTAKAGEGPDINRRRDPLENFPLDSLQMVGTLFRDGTYRVIIKTPEGAVQTAEVGNYMGQNYGKIIRIDENETVLLEQVLNSAGTWVEREASLTVPQQ
jgi:type IV pilus assembly protein PilP